VESLPACLHVTAETEDGVVMGVEHADLRAVVQGAVAARRHPDRA
jgi:anthranilate/para-aminobenzoate synthase component II